MTEPDRQPGEVERATAADIAALGDRVAERRTLVQLALRLARAIDAMPAEADATKTAGLVKELRATWAALNGAGDGDDGVSTFEAFVNAIRTPTGGAAAGRDTEDAEPGHARPGTRTGRRRSG